MSVGGLWTHRDRDRRYEHADGVNGRSQHPRPAAVHAVCGPAATPLYRSRRVTSQRAKPTAIRRRPAAPAAIPSGPRRTPGVVQPRQRCLCARRQKTRRNRSLGGIARRYCLQPRPPVVAPRATRRRSGRWPPSGCRCIQQVVTFVRATPLSFVGRGHAGADPEFDAPADRARLRRAVTWTRGVDIDTQWRRGRTGHSCECLVRPIYLNAGRVAVEKNLRLPRPRPEHYSL